MNSKSPAWISLSKIQQLVQLEPALMIVGLSIGAWIAYKLLLREISAERHRNLRKNFRNLLIHSVFAIAFYSVYLVLEPFTAETPFLVRVVSYFGLLALIWGSIVFVKCCRILVFEYLFLSHMREAVPLLLVNIVTLLISMILGVWLSTELFNIRITPILATSAIFSLIVGLAVQDTLGNLFAGISLQFDKPYEIGDWIEIQTGTQKWAGQVYEISWRATLLLGMTDEFITVPNRVVAQAQVSNFSAKHRPFIRSQIFHIAYGSPIDEVKKVMLAGVPEIPEVMKKPAPFVAITEMTDSWAGYKLVYFIQDYGNQFIIGDRVISSVMKALDAAGIRIATPRLLVERRDGALNHESH